MATDFAIRLKEGDQWRGIYRAGGHIPAVDPRWIKPVLTEFDYICHPGGDDNNNGQTLGQAFKTVNRLLEESTDSGGNGRPGVRLAVAGGTYVHNDGPVVSPVASGTEQEPIHLFNFNGEDATIDGFDDNAGSYSAWIYQNTLNGGPMIRWTGLNLRGDYWIATGLRVRRAFGRGIVMGGFIESENRYAKGLVFRWLHVHHNQGEGMGTIQSGTFLDGSLGSASATAESNVLSTSDLRSELYPGDTVWINRGAFGRFFLVSSIGVDYVELTEQVPYSGSDLNLYRARQNFKDYGTADTLYEYCFAHDNYQRDRGASGKEGDGIKASFVGDNLNINNCVFFRNGDDNVDLRQAVLSPTIEDCVFHSAGWVDGRYWWDTDSLPRPTGTSSTLYDNTGYAGLSAWEVDPGTGMMGLKMYESGKWIGSTERGTIRRSIFVDDTGTGTGGVMGGRLYLENVSLVGNISGRQFPGGGGPADISTFSHPESEIRNSVKYANYTLGISNIDNTFGDDGRAYPGYPKQRNNSWVHTDNGDVEGNLGVGVSTDDFLGVTIPQKLQDLINLDNADGNEPWNNPPFLTVKDFYDVNYFRPASGSPLKNAGTDGKDLGWILE
jgi:hypothetical protein